MKILPVKLVLTNNSTNVKNNTKQQIHFGELDGYTDDHFIRQNKTAEIIYNYEKRLADLAYLADEIEMDNDEYYRRKYEIEKRRDIELYLNRTIKEEY